MHGNEEANSSTSFHYVDTSDVWNQSRTFAEGFAKHEINITTYFKNLTIELHILYILNTHVNFCIN